MSILDYLNGQHVLVRSDKSGVHMGILVSSEGAAVRLKDSRRLWEWQVAGGAGISLSEVSIVGINQKGSRINMTLPDVVVFDVCEVIPALGLCVPTIMGAGVATPS